MVDRFDVSIVLVGSLGRCGIHEYSKILLGGFRELGHQARYVGVKRHDNRDLMRCMHAIERSEEVVIFEYEPGIFWLGGIVRALIHLRLRRKRILLSVHEIGPERYAEVRQIRWHLSRPVDPNGLLEIAKTLLGTADVVLRFIFLRVGLLLLGRLPHAVLVHSPYGAESVRLISNGDHKVSYVPHVVKQLEGNRDALRWELGLPGDLFAFIIPGFLFRRKRIIEVVKQLPSNAELWIVGTASDMDPGYLDELKAHLDQSVKREQVRLIHNYERMEDYLLAADALVLYYAECFQSGVASLGIGAGKPCIFSDLPAFDDLRKAGLTVRNPVELNRAMLRIQCEEVYTALARHAANIRREFSPRRIAAAYLESMR